MKLLYSNILPMAIKEGKETIAEAINSQIQLADRIDIAVGYVSRLALEEIDMLVEKHNIKNICLNLGMYFTEGMPEGSYHTALRINKKWKNLGIGEIVWLKLSNITENFMCFIKRENQFLQ